MRKQVFYNASWSITVLFWWNKVSSVLLRLQTSSALQQQQSRLNQTDQTKQFTFKYRVFTPPRSAQWPPLAHSGDLP